MKKYIPILDHLAAEAGYCALERLTIRELADRDWFTHHKVSWMLRITPRDRHVNKENWEVIRALRGYVRVKDFLGLPTPRGRTEEQISLPLGTTTTRWKIILPTTIRAGIHRSTVRRKIGNMCTQRLPGTMTQLSNG